MRRGIAILWLMMALAACANDEGEAEKKSDNSIVTPTSIISGYTGPVLNSNSSSDTCSEPDPNDPDAGCVAHTNQTNTSSAPLPLTEQTSAGLTIGVPAGFELLDLGNRWIISALDAEATPGEFTVTLRQASTEEVEAILGQIVGLDASQKIDRQNSDKSFSGYSIPYGERGEIGVFEIGQGQHLVINGFAAPGAWPTYSTTFWQMLDTLRFATE